MWMDALIPVAVVLVSYLLGSLSFAVIVSRLMGLNDPRSYGSKTRGPPMCCDLAAKRQRS